MYAFSIPYCTNAITTGSLGYSNFCHKVSQNVTEISGRDK